MNPPAVRLLVSPFNFVPIHRTHPDAHQTSQDKALTPLATFLTLLSLEPDVRRVEKRGWLPEVMENVLFSDPDPQS